MISDTDNTDTGCPPWVADGLTALANEWKELFPSIPLSTEYLVKWYFAYPPYLIRQALHVSARKLENNEIAEDAVSKYTGGVLRGLAANRRRNEEHQELTLMQAYVPKKDRDNVKALVMQLDTLRDQIGMGSLL